MEYATFKTAYDQTAYARFTLPKLTKHNTIWTNYPSSYLIVY